MLSLEQQNSLREEYRLAHPGWRPATEVYAEMVRRHLQPNSRALDLGCGRGGLVEQLGHPLHLVTAVDPDFDSLREHRLNMPRTAGMSQHLPFADDTFDLIFASWLLEHLERPLQTFQAIGRVLRRGGVFVFITPNRRHPLSLLNHAFGRFSQLQGRMVGWLYGRGGSDAFPTYYQANTVRTLQQLCVACDLRPDEIQTVPDPTYMAFTPALFRLMCRIERRLPADRQIHLVGAIRSSK